MESLIEKMEKSIGTDDFEFVMEECMMQMEENEVGIEAVTPLLQLMERHPLEDFGMPGAIVHFVERFYRNGYEKLLIESIERRPTLHTVWMLNRIINGSGNNAEYINLMNSILERKDVEDEIKNSIKEFLQ